MTNDASGRIENETNRTVNRLESELLMTILAAFLLKH